MGKDVNDSIIKLSKSILASYDYPITLRQLYYRLVSKGMINNQHSYSRLIRLMTRAREDRVIDPDSIEDRNRLLLNHTGMYEFDYDVNKFFSTRLNFFRESHQRFTLDIWHHQEYRVEVWSEKDAVRTELLHGAEGYRCPVCICRGYSSFSFIHSLLKRQEEIENWTSGQRILILYFGDRDPSGEDMVRDLQDRIIRYMGDYAIENAPIVCKVALTDDQVTELELPPAPSKPSDSRNKKFVEKHGDVAAVELDAIPPELLTQMVEEHIQAAIDETKWNEAVADEKARREELKEKLESWYQKGNVS
jgi:hypothetical protein